MSKTNAMIKNDMYGINEFNEKLQKKVFKLLGKAVYIDSIIKNIETNSVSYKIAKKCCFGSTFSLFFGGNRAARTKQAPVRSSKAKEKRTVTTGHTCGWQVSLFFS